MRNHLRACLFGLGIAASILALPAAAFADSFGAIAYSRSSGALGWSYDHSSRRSAEGAAVNSCGRYDCKVLWFKNGCGAVAAGPDGWGSGWGGNRRRAEREAYNSCSNNSDQCRVIRWQCSGAD